MTADEIGVLLNLRATLSEYEHFMCELDKLLNSPHPDHLGAPTGATFPMKAKLWDKARAMAISLRDLELGASAMATEPKAPKFKRGDLVKDKVSEQVYRVFATNMVALQDTQADLDSVPSQTLHEDMLDLYDGK